jgi:hypothetical protein
MRARGPLLQMLVQSEAAHFLHDFMHIWDSDVQVGPA